MASASGLSYLQRIRCRDRVVSAAKLANANRAQVSYTMGSKRWDGIANKKNSSKGEFPAHADCSSFATWCLWNGLRLQFNKGDIVNGLSWTAGFTGTMRDHGVLVWEPGDGPLLERPWLARGDCIFFTDPTSHVVIVMKSVVDGTLMVMSHGNETGPHYLKYKSTIWGQPVEVRRYI